MNLYGIKQAILNLTDIEFVRFQNWFDKIGCNRINKNAKTSKIRQAVLKLTEKDFGDFWDWFEDLCDERWAEEVENDPIARQCLEIGNMIMSKPDPGKFLVNLLNGCNEAKEKDQDKQSVQQTGRDERPE
jgi:hypothetical protein